MLIDNDARWRLVADDAVEVTHGMPPNSLRDPEKQEFEDPVNFMRRDTWNHGCQQNGRVLVVTYNTETPPDTGGVPVDYHSQRQVITVGLRWN